MKKVSYAPEPGELTRAGAAEIGCANDYFGGCGGEIGFSPQVGLPVCEEHARQAGFDVIQVPTC